MKQFKLLFAVLIAAVCLGSCKKDGGGEEELCAHNKLGVENFVIIDKDKNIDKLEIAEIGSQVKHKAKTIPGSAYVVSKRMI